MSWSRRDPAGDDRSAQLLGDRGQDELHRLVATVKRHLVRLVVGGLEVSHPQSAAVTSLSAPDSASRIWTDWFLPVGRNSIHSRSARPSPVTPTANERAEYLQTGRRAEDAELSGPQAHVSTQQGLPESPEFCSTGVKVRRCGAPGRIAIRRCHS